MSNLCAREVLTFITVLDLEPLYRRPSPTTLLETLQALHRRPSTFAGREDEGEVEASAIAEEGVPRYLTSIVGSSLAWIEDEAAREAVWELASQRLSERSGRTAQPSFQRSFVIPLLGGEEPLDVQVYEPSLTEDNLGHKTWGAAYLLAKRLPLLLPKLPMYSKLPSLHSNASGMPTVLELGAGTGLTGLALAMMAPCYVHLTDLPTIVLNLTKNIGVNQPALHRRQPHSVVSSFILDWSDLPTPETTEALAYDLVLAADPLYSPEHPRLVVQTIVACLKRSIVSRVVIEVPLRAAYFQERAAMKQGLEDSGLVLVEEGEETGFDDWGSGSTEVDCWWGVWKWTIASL